MTTVHRLLPRPAAALLILLLAAGCAGRAPLPEDHYYRLAAPVTARTFQNPPLPGVAVVEPLRAAGLYLDRGLLYSEDPQHLELKYYHYHRWSEPPPVLLQQQLITLLRAAGLAGAVVPDSGRTRADLRVTGRIRRFERLQTGQGWQAAVALELRADPARGGQPLLVRDYEAVIGAKGRDMQASVLAFSAATDQVLNRFLDDLSKALAADHPPPSAAAR